jgi:hypothetical protein
LKLGLDAVKFGVWFGTCIWSSTGDAEHRLFQSKDERGGKPYNNRVNWSPNAPNSLRVVEIGFSWIFGHETELEAQADLQNVISKCRRAQATMSKMKS